MKFTTVATTLFFAAVASAQCFDDFDCFFQGGHCAKTAGGLLGSCASSATAISSAPAATPTSGKICFDDGDCFSFPTSGKCIKGSSSITGYCQSPPATTKKAKQFAA